MRKKIIPLLLAAGFFCGALPLAGKEEQSKVLLPPEIGYKNLRVALSFARSFYKKKEFKKGFDLFKKCSEVKGLSDLHRAECFWYAGFCAEKAGEFAVAENYYKKALTCQGGKFTSDAAKSLRNLKKLINSENILPDGSFEVNASGCWNRMIDQEYISDCSWVQDDKEPFHGKYALRSSGKAPLTLLTEGFCSPGAFSIYMRSDTPGAKVKIEVGSYDRFAQQLLAGKLFDVPLKWSRLSLRIPKKWLKFETGTAPLWVRVTPVGKGTVWADAAQLEKENVTPFKPYKVDTFPVSAAKEKSVRKALPVFPPAVEFRKSDAMEVTVSYPIAAKNVPVEAALPLPQGKLEGLPGEFFVLAPGNRKIPAQVRPLALWPQDGSCRSVLVSFTADVQKGQNKFVIQTAPHGPLSLPEKRDLLPLRLSAEDAAGLQYVSRETESKMEFQGKYYTCFLSKGFLVNGDRALAPYTVRRKVWADGMTEISAVIKNPGRKILVLKNAALQIDSGRQGSKALYRQYFNKTKGTFTHAPDGKCGFVQSSGGTLLMREASLRHPVKMEVDEKGIFTAHLWPDDVKALVLSRKTVLHREFIYTPEKSPAAVDRLGFRAIAMAKPEYFAKSRFFVLPTGAWRKDQVFFKKALGDYSYFFSGDAKRIFNYPGRILHGLFNYGDVYGDGGWGNLESYLDFAEMIYAVSMNDPQVLGWALNRARHYRDSDIAGGVACYHSSNHSGGFGYDFSHSWPQGVLYHYLLTGDLQSWDVINEVIDNYISRPVDYPHIQGSRSLGRFLLGLADFYGLTGDEKIKKRFMEQLKFTEKNELSPKHRDQTLFRWHGRLDPFHVWYGCCAMMEYYLLTGDNAVLSSFKREMENSLNMDFYRNDLQQLWCGVPVKEALPIHCGYLSCHRGALFYPLMKFYSELTGDVSFLKLAQRSAYAAFLPGIPKAWPMDAMRLAVLENTPEKPLLDEVLALQKKAAAKTVLNGDFSKDPDWFTHWHLPAGRQMSYDDAVKSWPLKEEKVFPKLINEYREREHLVSPWRGYSRNYGFMDHKNFGKAAPSLRVTLSSKWAMGKSVSLACAPISAEKGEYKLSGVFKLEPGVASGTALRIFAVHDGQKRSRYIFPLTKTGKAVPDIFNKENFSGSMSCRIVTWEKPGWQKFELVFNTQKSVMLDIAFTFKLKSKSSQAHAWVDDIQWERIKK